MATNDSVPAGLLQGQVALVTGSSSGIGAAVARRYAREGARIVVNSSTSVEAGESLARELPEACYIQADIGIEADALRLVEEAQNRWGRLDILVNNAGTTTVIPHHDLDAASDDIWQRILGVNLIGTWHVTRAAVPALEADGGGSVINVTSMAGVRPIGSSIPYAVSKAAVNHLTLLLANVLGPGIRVNAVAPGLIDTPWTADWDVQRAAVVAGTPARRSGTADDVAEVCLLLATAGYTTGEVIGVDGGLHLR
jgi:ketoreductase RED2